MDTTMDALRTLRDMSDVELSRRSGVSRSTLHRIESGTASPTLRTLRELAIAVGADIDVTIRPLSDPGAARAARFLLDVAFADVTPTRFDRDWMNRLTRVSGHDPVAIIIQAGKASSPLSSPETIALEGGFSELRLASAGEASGAPWAVSGRAGLVAMAPDDVQVPGGPDVFYSADPHRVWRLLESPRRLSSPDRAGLLIAPWRDDCGVDSWEVGPITYVAPVQILIDAIGCGGALEEYAIEIAKRW